MITSTSNPQIKNLVLLGKKANARKEQGVFLAEGRKMFEEAPKEWIKKAYVTEAYLSKEEHQKRLDQIEYEIVLEHVMKAVCPAQTPQGILAVLKLPGWNLADVLAKKGGRYLFLENIQDPGNLGTMLRTGEAAGISAVIADGRTVDLYNPKTVRATMGSIYRVPFFAAEDFAKAVCEVRHAGAKIYAAHLKGQKMYDEADYTGMCGFLIGNEGNGLTEEAAGLADEYIRIPMAGCVESLNAGIAAAVLMYEADRQSR